jgi:hypothetical protein
MPIERREQLARASAERAQRDPYVGLMEISIGVAFFLGFFLVLVVLWLAAGIELPDWLGGTLFVLVFSASLALVTRGRRMRAEDADRVLAQDGRPPIVFLRPFGVDRVEIGKRMSSRVRISLREGFELTYEERLLRTLREVGPFVAVGDPTEGLPLLGAARTYATDEDWREEVDGFTAQASVVLLHVGESTGLGWEINHVIGRDTPERLILSLPLDAGRKEPSRQERYDAFRRTFGNAFPRPLPEKIGHCQFLYFDADWTPRLLGERGTEIPTGQSARDRALRRLAREFKIMWGPRWVRTLVYVSAVIAVVDAVYYLR